MFIERGALAKLPERCGLNAAALRHFDRFVTFMEPEPSRTDWRRRHANCEHRARKSSDLFLRLDPAAERHLVIADDVVDALAVNSIIGTLCGLFSNGPDGYQLTYGIAEEIIRDLSKIGAVHYRVRYVEQDAGRPRSGGPRRAVAAERISQGFRQGAGARLWLPGHPPDALDSRPPTTDG